jgi:hypothetical protein
MKIPSDFAMKMEYLWYLQVSGISSINQQEITGFKPFIEKIFTWDFSHF